MNRIANQIKPDLMVAMTEVPDMCAGHKSLKRSVNKSAFFLKSTLEAMKDTPTRVFGAIQGGLN